MKKITILILAGLVALMSACVYTESGTYYVDPVPGEPPSFQASTNLDTIPDPIVIDSLEVFYDVEIENGEFYQVEAYSFDEIVYLSDTIHGSFWIIHDSLYRTGIDTLSLFFFYSTNSNSLADIVGAEYNVLELEYPILYGEEEEP